MNHQSADSDIELNVHVRDEEWIKQENMNLFLSVAQGGQPPHFLEIHYTHKKRGDKQTDVAFVGKGITFDSGGISIKPSNGMASMKADMQGAAVVVCAFIACLRLRLPVNVSVFVPLCENMVGPKANKPGDVVVALNGTSVEIDNTDAEGRLILADALTWAQRTCQPKYLIDVATLTGAMAVALGTATTGFFSDSDWLSQLLSESGYRTGDKMWRMPLWDQYKNDLNSDVADLLNCSKKR